MRSTPVAALILILLGCDAHAAGITGTVGGPGGTGSFAVDSNGVIRVTKTFTSVDYIDVTITVPASTGHSGTPPLSISEGITNSTQTDWSDFHLELIVVKPSIGSILSPLSAPPPFTTIQYGDTSVKFGGGSVSTGEVFYIPYLTAGIVDPERMGYTMTIRQTPSVPEPETGLLALAGFGLFLSALRRKSRSMKNGASGVR